MFQKKRLKARKKSNTPFISIVGFFAVLAIFILAFVAINKVNSTNLNIYKTFLGPTGNVKNFLTLTPEEEQKIQAAKVLKEKQEAKKLDNSQKTNVLIIWRWWYGNDAPELTDSIILASIHKKKNHITMLSIPRDLYVNYGDENSSGAKFKGKINGLYVHYLAKYQDEDAAVEKLKEKITEITNEKIDYYVNIDFNWFIKLVDSIGWVQIDVPKTLVDHQYPNNSHWYQSFILRKWNWLLDWKVALKYVRSRKNTGWDFGRSHRQQQVITALKDKILSNWSISSPTRIKSLYNIFDKYVWTDISLISATKLFTQIKLQENTKVYSSGLNTSCTYEGVCEKWWYMYYPQRSYFGWTSVLLWESADYKNLDDFTEIQRYSNVVFNSPKLFDETYKISIFSRAEDKEDAQILREWLKKIWFTINVSERIWNIPEPTDEKLVATSEKKLNLQEYNELNINQSTQSLQTNSWISIESNNTRTKVITNWVPLDSITRSYLQEYLDIWENDIVENIGWPKYARDQSTQIEIIYTQQD